MRLPASKLASAAHTPLCTSQCYRADNRAQDVLWTSALRRPERSGDREAGGEVASAEKKDPEGLVYADNST